jgi:hypothetical protein
MSETKPSGLKNPGRAVRAVGSATLALQAVVLLLALVPMAKLGGPGATPAIWLCVGLAVVSIVLAGMLGRSWAWWAGPLVPLALVVAGFVWHWSLAVLGVLFALLWVYVLNVRRTVLSGQSA